MNKKRILSVSYDEPLLLTRHMILEREGFEVRSVLGFIKGMEACPEGPYDLMVMGHSMPRTDKIALMEEFRRHSRAPVLSIRRHGDLPLPGADASVEAIEGPEVLVSAVHNCIDFGCSPRPRATSGGVRRRR